MAGTSIIKLVDLALLQSQCKKDPEAYRNEFSLQYAHFQSLCNVYKIQGSEDSMQFERLITFVSHVAPLYREETRAFAPELMSLLEERAEAMSSSLRICMVKALILLSNRAALERTKLLPVLFMLFRVADKTLRPLIYSHVVHDIRRANDKHKNNKVNTALQSFMHKMLSDSHEMVAAKALDTLMELHRRNVWNDERTVNLVAAACFSPFSKVSNRAVRFFIMSDRVRDDDDEDEERQQRAAQLSERVHEAQQRNNNFSRKTTRRKRLLQRRLDELRKERREQNDRDLSANVNFPALQLIHDPQTFAEKLLRRLRASKEKFENRLMLMNLTARVISHHELLLPSFYAVVLRYLRPSQEHVTYVLALLAQSVHSLVDPDDLHDLVRAIVNNFVSDGARFDVVTVGLNALREVCARQPLVMDAVLLSDLAEYARHRDKGVATAARGLVNLYRELNPALLHRRKRGKAASILGAADKHVLGYAELNASKRIDGADLLEEMEAAATADADERSESDESGDAANRRGFYIDRNDGRRLDEVQLVEDDDSDDEDKSDCDELESDAAADARLAAELTAADADAAVPMDVTERKSIPIERRRILGDDDFARIAEYKEELAEALGSRKRKASSISTTLVEPGSRVEIEDIERAVKRAKNTKDERIQSVLAGREGREKFTSSFSKKVKSGGASNLEKTHRKSYAMVRHGSRVRRKVLESMVQRQMRRHKAISKEKKKVGRKR